MITRIRVVCDDPRHRVDRQPTVERYRRDDYLPSLGWRSGNWRCTVDDLQPIVGDRPTDAYNPELPLPMNPDGTLRLARSRRRLFCPVRACPGFNAKVIVGSRSDALRGDTDPLQTILTTLAEHDCTRISLRALAERLRRG
jgi:hypothetical protein